MKRMKKAGILASAIATTAICGSLVAGATFALFTDSDKVDITVSSGKVAVAAQVQNITVTNAKSITSNGDTYTADYTGAEAKALETNGKSVAVANIIPADKVEFDIVLQNEGSVTANYQFAINCVGGYELMRAFDVKIENKDTSAVVFDEATAKAGETKEVKDYTSAWVKDFKKDTTATYHVTLSLPASTGNEAADVTAKIEATVYAVQFNADVQDGENVEWVEQAADGLWAYEVNSQTEFETVLKETLADENAKVVLNQGAALESGALEFEGSANIDLNGQSLDLNKYSLNPTGADANLTITNGTINATTAKNNASVIKAREGAKVELDGVTLEPEGEHWGLMGYGISCFDDSEIVIKNSKIVGGVALGTNANSQNLNPNIVIEDSVIEGFSAGLLFNAPGTLTVKNSTISGINQGVFVRAGNATFTNCTIYNTLDNRGTGTKLDPAAAGFNAYYDNFTPIGDTGEGDFGKGTSGVQNIPLSSLVVGCSSEGYADNAYVKLIDTTVTNTFPETDSKGVAWKVYGVLVWGKSTGSATVEYDAASASKISSSFTFNGGIFKQV